MPRAANTTTDHDEIRRWAEAQGGHPAAVMDTGDGRDDPGVLRIDFLGSSGDELLRPISWDEFFEALERKQLALRYRPEERFNKLVSRETASETPRASQRRGKARGKASAQPAAARRTRTTARSPRAKKATKSSAGARSKAAPRAKGRPAKASGGKRGGSRRGG